MVKQFIMIGLLSLSTLVLFGTEASARVCLLSQGGSCVFWSGSLECNMNADQVGSLKDHPQLSCDITPQLPPTTTGPVTLLLCGNPGKKTKAAPGAQVTQLFFTLPEFGNSVTLTKANQQTGGIYTATTIASTDLTQLDQFCPNTGWKALDAVSCAGSITVTQSNDPDNPANFICTLQSCETLGFDPVTVKFDRRQYSCTQQ